MARSVRMCSWVSVSDIEARVWRAMPAAEVIAIVTTGSTSDRAHAAGSAAKGTNPVAGSSRSCTAKTKTSRTPTQNAGTESRTPESAVMNRSAAPPRTAAVTPRTMPTTALSSVPNSASAAVTGSRLAMSGPIGRPSISETPRLPCSTCPTHAKYCWSHGSYQPIDSL